MGYNETWYKLKVGQRPLGQKSGQKKAKIFENQKFLNFLLRL